MPLRNGGFVFYVDVWSFFNRPAVGLFELRNISQLVRGRTMCASTRVVILKALLFMIWRLSPFGFVTKRL